MKTIAIDSICTPAPKVQDPEPLICTLDGVQYFLGPEAPDLMAWKDAMDWCESLGKGYELPSWLVLLACFVNPEIRKHFAASYYWSSSEFSSTDAWSQYFDNCRQNVFNKTHTLYVRAVRRVVL